MTQRLPVLKGEQLSRVLKRGGWFEVKGNGAIASLRPYQAWEGNRPHTTGRDIEPWLLRKILNRVSLSPDEFVRLL